MAPRLDACSATTSAALVYGARLYMPGFCLLAGLSGSQHSGAGARTILAVPRRHGAATTANWVLYFLGMDGC